MREEMAETLSDIVFRRTDLGTAGIPDNESLVNCASFVAKEKGWSVDKTTSEINQVKSVRFPGSDLTVSNAGR